MRSVAWLHRAYDVRVWRRIRATRSALVPFRNTDAGVEARIVEDPAWGWQLRCLLEHVLSGELGRDKIIRDACRNPDSGETRYDALEA